MIMTKSVVCNRCGRMYAHIKHPDGICLLCREDEAKMRQPRTWRGTKIDVDSLPLRKELKLLLREITARFKR